VQFAKQITSMYDLAYQQLVVMQDLDKGEYSIQDINPLILNKMHQNTTIHWLGIQQNSCAL